MSSACDVTEDHLDIVMQTNYLGHFLLTNLLASALNRADNPKVVNITSALHRLANISDLNNLGDPRFKKKSVLLVSLK